MQDDARVRGVARGVRAQWPATPGSISSGHGEAAADGESLKPPQPHGLAELEALLACVRDQQPS